MIKKFHYLLSIYFSSFYEHFLKFFSLFIIIIIYYEPNHLNFPNVFDFLNI